MNGNCQEFYCFFLKNINNHQGVWHAVLFQFLYFIIFYNILRSGANQAEEDFVFLKSIFAGMRWIWYGEAISCFRSVLIFMVAILSENSFASCLITGETILLEQHHSA